MYKLEKGNIVKIVDSEYKAQVLMKKGFKIVPDSPAQGRTTDDPGEKTDDPSLRTTEKSAEYTAADPETSAEEKTKAGNKK